MRLFRKSKKKKSSPTESSAGVGTGTPAVDALPHDGVGSPYAAGGVGIGQSHSGGAHSLSARSSSAASAGSSKYQLAMAAYRDTVAPGESDGERKPGGAYGVGSYDNPMDDVRARMHYRPSSSMGESGHRHRQKQQRGGGDQAAAGSAAAAGATGLEGPCTAVGIAASGSSASSDEFVGGGSGVGNSGRSLLPSSSGGGGDHSGGPAHDEESPPLPMAEASARRKTPDAETGGGDDQASAAVGGPDLLAAPSYADGTVSDAGASHPPPPSLAEQTLSGGPSAILGRHHRTQSLDDAESTTLGGSSDSVYGLGAGAAAARIPPPYSSNGTPYKRSTSLRPEVPDTVYEERYGDAYVGGPLRYTYPSGYQSMRPRSGPWKLSVAVTSLFTWLSVFIVGHCSDRADTVLADYPDGAGYDFDDDVLVMETKWCGSRMLYFMWVVSVIITGVACAYCGIIGYIKVRDFAVANQRSQPPGMAGKSDYYVRLDEAQAAATPTGGGGPNNPRPPGGAAAYGGSYQDGRTSIYQSDGNPQFWGSHIYRPTQAAVMVTSR